MKQKNLWLLCGVPGCGKTTYVQKQLSNSNADCVHVSRDVIRFSLLEDTDEYFSKESEVFDKFIEQIQKGLDENGNVFADATHLNEKSRNKTLDKLKLDDVNIIPIVFDLPLDICLTQNANRTGRAYVPEGAIERMFNSFTIPNENEKYQYKKIIYIKGE